jgi:hypothetical protein
MPKREPVLEFLSFEEATTPTDGAEVKMDHADRVRAPKPAPEVVMDCCEELAKLRLIFEERNVVTASQLSGAHVGRWITFPDGNASLLVGVSHRADPRERHPGKVRLQLRSFDNRHGGLTLIPEDTLLTVTDEKPSTHE